MVLEGFHAKGDGQGHFSLCPQIDEAIQSRWNEQVPQSISWAVGAADPAASGFTQK